MRKAGAVRIAIVVALAGGVLLAPPASAATGSITDDGGDVTDETGDEVTDRLADITKVAITNTAESLTATVTMAEIADFDDAAWTSGELSVGVFLGDPSDPATEFGAVVSKLQFDKVSSYLKLAPEEGGRILLGGAPLEMPGRLEQGWFIVGDLL